MRGGNGGVRLSPQPAIGEHWELSFAGKCFRGVMQRGSWPCLAPPHGCGCPSNWASRARCFICKREKHPSASPPPSSPSPTTPPRGSTTTLATATPTTTSSCAPGPYIGDVPPSGKTARKRWARLRKQLGLDAGGAKDKADDVGGATAVDGGEEPTPEAISALVKARSALPKSSGESSAVDAAGLVSALSAAVSIAEPQEKCGEKEKEVKNVVDAPVCALKAALVAIAGWVQSQNPEVGKGLLALAEQEPLAQLAKANAADSAPAKLGGGAGTAETPLEGKLSSVQRAADLKVKVSRLEKKRADLLTFSTEARERRRESSKAKAKEFELKIERLVAELDSHRKALTDFKLHEELADKEWAESDAKDLAAIDDELTTARQAAEQGEKDAAAAGERQALRPKARLGIEKEKEEETAPAKTAEPADAAATSATAAGGGSGSGTTGGGTAMNTGRIGDVSMCDVICGDVDDGDGSDSDGDLSVAADVEAPLAEAVSFEPPQFDLTTLTTEDRAAATHLRATLRLWMSQPVAVPMSYGDLGVSVAAAAALVGQTAWAHCYTGASGPQATDPMPRTIAVVLLDAVSRLAIEHVAKPPDTIVGSLKRATTSTRKENLKKLKLKAGVRRVRRSQ